MPTLSISRIRHAISARFAASATRFRSRMKASVLCCLTCLGCGGTKFWDDANFAAAIEDCVDVEEELLWCAVMGEVIGASILRLSWKAEGWLRGCGKMDVCLVVKFLGE
jgi:hypothetical protein